MNMFRCTVFCVTLALAPMLLAADAKQQLATMIDAMAAYRADFRQEIIDPDGDLLQESSGRVHARQPGQFRWEITQPDQQLIIRNGSRLWRYEADLEQVTIDTLTEEELAAGGPALLLAGDSKPLLESYTVEASDRGFALTPLGEDSFIRLTVVIEEGMLQGLELTDIFDQVTRIRFLNVTVNGDMDASLFDFVPPAGTEVISND